MEIHNSLTPVRTKTSVALGYFDGMHLGHREIIIQAVTHAKRLRLRSTVFTFDFSKTRPGDKGPGDLFPKKEKFAEMERLGVDLIVEVPFTDIRNLSGREFISKVLGHGCLNAAVVCCGEDFRFGKGRGSGADTMERLAGSRGIKVNVVPYVMDDGIISTTRIKRLVAEGNIQRAAVLLGRPYIIGAYAVKKAIGVGINFSSVSQKMDESLQLPKYGVYTSRANVNGKWMDSVTYIGTRPSRNGDGIFADTNIFALNGKTYTDGWVEVELLRMIRQEEKFESLSALKDAITADIQKAKLRR